MSTRSDHTPPPDGYGDETHSAPPSDPNAVWRSLLTPPERPDELGRFGGYRILGELGRGGMGVVLRADDPKLDRLVALKIMLPAFAADPTARKRFVREAKAQAAVNHHHIVTIHDTNEAGGVPFLVMPLLKGQTLADHLQDHRPTEREIARIGRQIAEGLAAAHDADLMHRDIKPGNIWLEGTKREVKILDFGLARHEHQSDGDDHAPLTAAGGLVGSPPYMSPEQARGEHPDSRTDLFSLGAVLYRMATGVLPFRGEGVLAVLTQVVNATPAAPRQLNPALSVGLEQLILRLLSKNPDDRPDSAAAVAAELEAFEGRAPTDPLSSVVSRPPGNFDATKTMLQPTRRRTWWPVAVVGVLVVGAAAVVASVFAFQNPTVAKTDPPPTTSEAKPPDVPKEEPWTDPHRAAAIAFLEAGWRVEILTHEWLKFPAQVSDLPEQSFVLWYVGLAGKEYPAELLNKLQGLTTIQAVEISTTQLADADLKTFGASTPYACGHNYTQISDKGVAILASNRQLCYVGIASQDVTDECVPDLLHLEQLTGLSITSSKITHVGLEKLTGLRRLSSLSMGGNLDARAVRVLQKMPHLQRLVLFAADDAQVAELEMCQQLRCIDFGGGTKSLAAVQRLQVALPNTVVLHPDLAPSPAEVKAVEWLLANNASLSLYGGGVIEKEVPKRTFALYSITMPGDGPKTGAKNLKGIRSVERLLWGGLQDADEEVAQIATLDSLLVLDLTGSDVSATGVRRLATLKHLVTLNLSYCPNMTDAAVRELTALDGLQELHLNGTPVTADSIASLSKLACLRQLSLYSCPQMTGEGIEQLAALRHLHHLSLGATAVDDSVVAGLKTLTQLRSLDLQKTKVTPAGVAELQKALPQCAIFWDGGLVIPGGPAVQMPPGR